MCLEAIMLITRALPPGARLHCVYKSIQGGDLPPELMDRHQIAEALVETFDRVSVSLYRKDMGELYRSFNACVGFASSPPPHQLITSPSQPPTITPYSKPQIPTPYPNPVTPTPYPNPVTPAPYPNLAIPTPYPNPVTP